MYPPNRSAIGSPLKGAALASLTLAASPLGRSASFSPAALRSRGWLACGAPSLPFLIQIPPLFGLGLADGARPYLLLRKPASPAPEVTSEASVLNHRINSS